jgi:imidazoleglycerol-phosphate dehydratase
MKKRKALVKRATRETNITVSLNLDGAGKAEITTGIGFFDHMLELLAKHSLIDMKIRARGDLRVDAHHTVEDVGICLGEALKKALGKKEAIGRYGFFFLPMDEALASVALDLSGRPYLRYAVNPRRKKIGTFDIQLVEEFLSAFVSSAGITLHVDLITGKNLHHIIEAVFKALARALEMAVTVKKRGRGVPSTKGTL